MRFTDNRETADDLRVRLAQQVLDKRRTLRYGGAPVTEWDDAQQATEDVLAGILGRHVRGTTGGYSRRHEECGWCTEHCRCGGMSVAWPCLELKVVLDALVPKRRHEARAATRRRSHEAAARADDARSAPEAAPNPPLQKAGSDSGASPRRMRTAWG